MDCPGSRRPRLQLAALQPSHRYKGPGRVESPRGVGLEMSASVRQADRSAQRKGPEAGGGKVQGVREIGVRIYRRGKFYRRILSCGFASDGAIKLDSTLEIENGKLIQA